MMARVPANEAELGNATNNHHHAAERLDFGERPSPPSRSSILLRLYGVESGFKARYLREKKLRTTNEIPDEAFGEGGHDLEQGIRTLRLPGVLRKPPQLALQRSKRGKQQRIHIRRAHEALRYGVDIERKDVDALNDWLKRVLTWLEENSGA